MDHVDSDTLQSDIDALYNRSIENKINFHPDKYKVLIVTNQTEKKSLLFSLLIAIHIR